MKRIMTVCAALAALEVSTLQAVEVTSGQAKTAAGNWIRRNQTQMKSKFRSTAVKDTLTARDASGRALYHAVNLDGGGFVVTSGYTRLTPVVAFSETGSYRDDKDNPLYVLLQADRSNAVAAVNGHASKGTRTNDRIAAAESEWKSLLSNKRDGGNSSKGLASSVSGVYVDKLIKTKWGQSSWDGYDDGISVFNYSTPKNYVCGCVATVGAQIMRYWQYPTAEIPQFYNTCFVDDSPVTRNSIAGAFNWANMPLSCETTPTVTEAHQKAIGMLMYNVGVAVGMSWHSGSSGASPSYLPNALETRFGYQSGGTFVFFAINLPVGYTSQDEALKNVLYASIDAGMPVCVSVQGLGGNWTRSGANVYVDVTSASLSDEVLAEFLPDGEPVIPAGGKWRFHKATSVKWARPKRGAEEPDVFDPDSGKGLIVDKKGKPNLSGLKLTYTPKKGTFKGSFKMYALEGEGKATKQKKFTVKVSGVVVDGIGYGTATCKNPAIVWSVSVE